MAFDPIISPRRLERLTAAGLWRDELVVDHLDRVAKDRPDAVAVVDPSRSGIGTNLTFRRVKRLSERVAVGLLELGVGPGDVVAVQLPNWWHYFVLYPACARIGAVLNPLMPIFRQRELEFMLGFARTKVVVIPRVFRGFDYPAMLDGLRPALPALRHVLVVDGPDPRTSFEQVLLERRWEDGVDLSSRLAPLRPGPNEVTELMYTSGTTGEPKGVMHTANTLLCKARLARELFALQADDVVLMGSPLAHQTGFMYGCLFSLVHGLKCVLQDVWEPVTAARLIQDERCTLTLGSTPFLSDLVHVEAARRYDTSSLRLFLCAGAPIPRVLLRGAAEAYPSLYVMSAWGMTENGIVTATYPGDDEEKVFETDGRALPHQEVRVVGDDGAPLPPGEEGRLQARGPTTFVGYCNRPEAYAVDEDLWFETGDNARMDRDGYIRITGRSKDIIIRGGENVPVVEVEELLYRHPAVQDAAIVGMPDERLGERGCAFVQLRAGATLSFEEMVAFLSGQRLARNYLPERLEIIEEFPRTPSGKIQKFKLRELVGELPPAPSPAPPREPREGAAAPVQPVFTARDDRFHFAEMGDDWWATETAWFSFHHPERKLGGWLYTLARPNIGTVAGGAWVWDERAHLPWEVLYSANYSALALPAEGDLDDVALPTGVSVRVLEPCTSYALGYHDRGRFEATLRFDAVMPPEPLTAAGSTFGAAHHFDQLGRVSGRIRLHGEELAIDCIAMRDRTWGRRPEDRPRQAAYVTGAASAGHGFLAVTNARPDGDRVAYGFLRRDGRTVALAAGERRVERDPTHGWVTRIGLRASDREGRTLDAVGETVSRIVVNRHTFIDVNSLVRWRLDGEMVAWGEDQDMWPVHRWARMRREGP